MPTAQVKDTQFYYLQTGQGPDIVFVHGLASNLAFWYSGIVLPLRYQYRVTAFDLRGHGRSSMPPDGYTHLEMANDLLELVDYWGLKRFHLVGHSFGGLISISFALRHQHRLASLTLADVPLNSISQEWPYWWPVLLDRLNHLGIAIPDDEPFPELRILEELAHKEVRELVQDTVPVASRLPYGWGKGSERTAQRWLDLLSSTTAREDVRVRAVSPLDLKQIRVPTLVTFGTDSKWISSAEVLKTCLPRYKLVCVEDAGHAHPWEHPDIFLNSFLGFVQEIEQQDQSAGSDRRMHERIIVELNLELQGSGEFGLPVKSVNVSRKGILIMSPQNLYKGSEIVLKAFLKPNGQTAKAKGKIVWKGNTSNSGILKMGVELTDIYEGRQAWENLTMAASRPL
jgi:pimeloyl-ACP methyl ester carboxylesterase